MKLYIFNSLPQVQKFLFCIKLKIGCIIIVAAYIFFILEAFISRAAIKEFKKCYFTRPFMQFMGYSALTVCIITFAASVYFLYGIFKMVPKSAICFMYGTVLLIVFNMITSVILMFMDTDCSTPFLFGGANFFGALLLIYFLVIVNSHYRNMVDEISSKTQDTGDQSSHESHTEPQIKV